MKFRASSPSSWVYFFLSTVNILISCLLALFVRSEPRVRIRVALFGHQFNGNLRVFFDRVGRFHPRLHCRFIYIDHNRYRRWCDDGTQSMSALRIDHMFWVARADVFMCDHGVSVFWLLKKLRPSIKFIDVWHGIGFKPIAKSTHFMFRDFSAILTSSSWVQKHSYITARYLAPERVYTTGYAITDPLVCDDADLDAIIQRFRLDGQFRGRVLFAPTWQQDVKGRPIIPFGLEARDFFSRLNRWGRNKNVQIVIRMHMNDVDAHHEMDYSHTVFRPMRAFPLTYELLLVTDVLITDWSSIATDFLPLNRPIIFLDVSAPFTHGFLLTPDDRVGYIASDFNQVEQYLQMAIADPQHYRSKFSLLRARVIEKAYSDTLDGKCSERYGEIIEKVIREGTS